MARLRPLAFTLIACMAGCGHKQAPRLPVFPVSGQLRIDGRPAAGAEVYFQPRQPIAGLTTKPVAKVDAAGDFAGHLLGARRPAGRGLRSAHHLAASEAGRRRRTDWARPTRRPLQPSEATGHPVDGDRRLQCDAAARTQKPLRLARLDRLGIPRRRHRPIRIDRRKAVLLENRHSLGRGYEFGKCMRHLRRGTRSQFGHRNANIVQLQPPQRRVVHVRIDSALRPPPGGDVHWLELVAIGEYDRVPDDAGINLVIGEMRRPGNDRRGPAARRWPRPRR